MKKLKNPKKFPKNQESSRNHKIFQKIHRIHKKKEKIQKLSKMVKKSENLEKYDFFKTFLINFFVQRKCYPLVFQY